MIRRRLTSKQREALYNSEAEKAREAGRGEFPICNICDTAIIGGSLWDESHDRHAPHWLTGASAEACAHRRCNRIHGQRHDVSLYAKSERTLKKFLDLKRSRTPMAGGRDDSIRKKMNGEVVLRATGQSPYPRITR